MRIGIGKGIEKHTMNYEEALAYIHNVAWMGKKPGLERMQRLLCKLGNPQERLKFIHVAGTNGKGSTCAMLASVLKEAGYKTGLFTSPYIHVFNERIQVNGQMISNEDLTSITERIRDLVEEMEEKPTVFELITLLGMEYFKRQQCDIVVLEAGIGGLLDSTNVIGTKEAAVITSIGFDHTAMLGNTIKEIAAQKAGIIKENTDVIFQGRDKEALEVVEAVCERTHSRLYCPDYTALKSKSFDLLGQSFDYKTYKNLTIPLLGLYQLENAAIAITALEVLAEKGYAITKEHMTAGLSKAVWIGRFQVLRTEPVVIADGSHNPPGIAATAESLKKHFPDKRIIFVMGVMADKEIEKMAESILPLAREIFTVAPDNPRAMRAEALAELLKQKAAKMRRCAAVSENTEKEVCQETKKEAGQGTEKKVCQAEKEDLCIKAFLTVPKACEEAVRCAGKDGVVCALGSLYLVDEVEKALGKSR